MDPVIFQPFYQGVNRLLAHYQKPLIEVRANSRKWTYMTVSALNLVKKVFVGTIILVSGCTLAAFSLITWPYRYNKLKTMRFDKELEFLTLVQKGSLRYKVTEFIDNLCLSKKLNIPADLKEDFITKAMVYYARSRKYYAPVLLEWTHYLLSKANDPSQAEKINAFHCTNQAEIVKGKPTNSLKSKKIVFLARDGIPPYRIATQLLKIKKWQERYPNLKPNHIVLAHLSRKLVDSCFLNKGGSHELFRKYVNQELGIQKGDELLIVDIGFAGRVIDPVREMLPDNKIEFEYLMSHTKRATGYLAGHEVPLSSVPSAGANWGIHWLEDTHQGVYQSAEQLKPINGRIYPNTIIPGQELDHLGSEPTPETSLEYILKKLCEDGGVEEKDLEKEPCAPVPNKPEIKNEKKIRFTNELNSLLEKIKAAEIPLFIKHK